MGTAYIIRETEASLTICNKNNQLEEISKTAIKYDQFNLIKIDNKLKLAYPGVKKVQIQIHQERKDRLPVAHLGDGNQLIIEWVYPIRIVYMKNSLENFRIYAPFVCFHKGGSGTIVDELSACK